MSDTSGPPAWTPFAFFDPDSSSLKMSQLSFQQMLEPSSTTSSPTWPKQGLMRNGECFELPTLGRPIDVSESSLLPTPSAMESTPTDEYMRECEEAGIQPDERLYLPGRKWHSQRTLSRVVPTLLPTPAARDHKGGTEVTSADQLTQARGDGGASDLPSVAGWVGIPTPQARDHKGPLSGTKGGKDLSSEVLLLPTPAASDHKGAASPEAAKDWEHRGTNLPEAMQRASVGIFPEGPLLPTPAAWDEDRGPDYARMEREGSGGDDLTTSVARLTGDRMRQPSPDGSESSDDQPPDLWTTTDA